MEPFQLDARTGLERSLRPPPPFRHQRCGSARGSQSPDWKDRSRIHCKHYSQWISFTGSNCNSARRQVSERGSILVFTVLLWIPIFILGIGALWIRVKGTDFVVQQRRLDRCIYAVVQGRCSTLNQLSTSNQYLRRIGQALTIVETLKTAGAIVPIAGTGMAIALGASAEIARATANGIARVQDALLMLETVRTWSALRCGWPVQPLRRLGIQREGSASASLANVPAPLEWASQQYSKLKAEAESEIDFVDHHGRFRSYGHCHSPDNNRLDGESYGPRMSHPDNRRVIGKANAFSKRF